MVLHVDLAVASGLVKLYLKQPDKATQLWVEINLKIKLIVQADYVKDELIMSW